MVTGMQDYVWGWRFSLGFAIIPALMFLAGAIIAPDSPNSLLLNGKAEKARQVRLRLLCAPLTLSTLPRAHASSG